MTLTLELPPEIREEIAREAMREGIPEAEHASLLLYLASALLQEGTGDPFRQTVRAMLRREGIDPERMRSVFERLVRAASTAMPGTGTAPGSFEPCAQEPTEDEDPVAHVRDLLARWRSEDSTIPRPVAAGVSPTAALFKGWEEEDATLSETEAAQRQALFEEYQYGIDEDRRNRGMRTLF